MSVSLFYSFLVGERANRRRNVMDRRGYGNLQRKERWFNALTSGVSVVDNLLNPH